MNVYVGKINVSPDIDIFSRLTKSWDLKLCAVDPWGEAVHEDRSKVEVLTFQSIHFPFITDILAPFRHPIKIHLVRWDHKLLDSFMYRCERIEDTFRFDDSHSLKQSGPHYGHGDC